MGSASSMQVTTNAPEGQPTNQSPVAIAGPQEIATVLATSGGGKALPGNALPISKVTSLRNRSEIGRYITSCGVEINPDANGEVEAVLCACQFGHLNILSQLRQLGIDIHARDHDGVTSLMTASLNGHLQIVEFLLKNGAEINVAADDGATSLMCAAQNGHERICQRLIASGAQVAARSNSGFTALHFAALNCQLSAVKVLTTEPRSKNAIDVNAADDDLVTPLMCACFCGSPEIVQQLLKCGANAKLANHDGMTPIFYAVANAQLEIVKLLVRSNSGNNRSGSDGGSESSSDTVDQYEQARDIAEEMGDTEMVEYLNTLL